MRFAAAALALLAASAGCREDAPAAAAPERPELHLITALPLLFDEQFTLEGERPAVAAWLDQRYRLSAIDLPSQLPPAATLLMIQPVALPAEELVSLDRWVRGGGRLLLLADPRLEWPSERPLGDPLRPPPMYADTGLLGHWGLRLDSPERAGPVTIEGVTYGSPGTLVANGPQCVVRNKVAARCKVGGGQAVVVADADWIADGAQADKLGALIESLRR
ncbi:MAG TPA: DUF4350 domain-containing protein [Sphingomicrobium sp.]|nr:DUF4350 domain-containing protein [Sphingomicrobium sp.]